MILGPIVLAVAWVVSFVFIVNTRSRKLSYLAAVVVSGLVLWKEYNLLVPDSTAEQLVSASIFVASLAVATVSDFYDMLIPRFCSIWLAPFWLLFAYFGLAPITFYEATLGAGLGYFVPWSIAWFFLKVTGRHGMGEGDMELLAMIGGFVGVCSVLTSLYLGTLIALITGLPYLYFVKKDLRARFPFGPSLALGALLSFRICLI